MRSGPASRCASYCTWSSRSRTTVLESADDQWRIPVTRGNFDNSCAVAGVLSGSLASEVASGAAFVSVVGFADAGATFTSFVMSAGAGLTGIFSVRIIALPNWSVLSFHHTPPANAVAITMHTSRISMTGRRVAASVCSMAISGAAVATAVSTWGAFSAGLSRVLSTIGDAGAWLIFATTGLLSIAGTAATGTTGAATTGAGATGTARAGTTRATVGEAIAAAAFAGRGAGSSLVAAACADSAK